MIKKLNGSPAEHDELVVAGIEFAEWRDVSDRATKANNIVFKGTGRGNQFTGKSP